MNDYNSLKEYIFIGGCPRSGTTLLGTLLGKFENTVVTPESKFKHTLPSALRVNWDEGVNKELLFKKLFADFYFNLWEIDTEDISKVYPEILTIGDYSHLLTHIVDRYASSTQSNFTWKTWVDHTPSNFQCALLLMRLFPNAKFIHIVRDPRAVVPSLIKCDWGPDDPKSAAFYWMQKLAPAICFEQLYPDKCLRVNYESLLVNTSTEINRIRDYCGLTKAKTESSSYTIPEYAKRQHRLVNRSLDPSRIDAWKKELDLTSIGLIESSLGDFMAMMGYEKLLVGRKYETIKRNYSRRERVLFKLAALFKKRRRARLKKQIVSLGNKKNN